MPILDKITKATQDVVRGAKDMTDTARQNSLIAEEEKRIPNLYMQIGKLYYETHEADQESQLGMLCLAIKAANERIAGYNEEIRKIKGAARCPSCGAEMPIDSFFCGSCGMKFEMAPVPHAPDIPAPPEAPLPAAVPVAPEVMQQPEPPPPEPVQPVSTEAVKRFCPSCGTQTDESVVFCKSCGTKQ